MGKEKRNMDVFMNLELQKRLHVEDMTNFIDPKRKRVRIV